MKLKLYLTVLVLTAFLFGLICGMQARRYPDPFAERHIVAQQAALDRTPTIKEIQRKVGAKEDGIVGPETLAKWDEAICTQYAIESIERMAKGDKE